MIVCVLLVSNSRGCCLATPGDHEAAPSWSPGAARQHPREFDTNNTHTIMFDPLINICEILLHNRQLVVITHELIYGVWAAHH